VKSATLRIAAVLALVTATLAASSTAGAAENDIDGDGISDLVIGAPAAAVDGPGRVHVFASASPDVALGQGSPGVPGGFYPGNAFGASVTMADFDGDGFTDAAVGAPRERIVLFGVLIGCGSVTVLYGSATGLSRGSLLSSYCHGVGGQIASGDLNGDGYADIATSMGHSVTVFYGGPLGLVRDHSLTFDQNTPGVADTTENGDGGIGALAIGSFDGDEYDDLAIGVPFEDVGLPRDRSAIRDAGAVHIVRGSMFGVLPRWSTYWTKGPAAAGSPLTPTAGGSLSRNDQFGRSLCVADFDGDGFDELAIGVPGEIVNTRQRAGAMRVLHGGASGLDTSAVDVWTQNSPSIRGRAERLDEFGSACSTGDLDADGNADLVISTAREVVTVDPVGVVQAIFGAADGLASDGNEMLVPGLSADWFNNDVFVGDANGDGIDDLLIAAQDNTGVDFGPVVLIAPGGPAALALSIFVVSGMGGEDTELGVLPS
jgi:hypothetical protein